MVDHSTGKKERLYLFILFCGFIILNYSLALPLNQTSNLTTIVYGNHSISIDNISTTTLPITISSSNLLSTNISTSELLKTTLSDATGNVAKVKLVSNAPADNTTPLAVSKISTPSQTPILRTSFIGIYGQYNQTNGLDLVSGGKGDGKKAGSLFSETTTLDKNKVAGSTQGTNSSTNPESSDKVVTKKQTTMASNLSSLTHTSTTISNDSSSVTSATDGSLRHAQLYSSGEVTFSTPVSQYLDLATSDTSFHGGEKSTISQATTISIETEKTILGDGATVSGTVAVAPDQTSSGTAVKDGERFSGALPPTNGESSTITTLPDTEITTDTASILTIGIKRLSIEEWHRDLKPVFESFLTGYFAGSNTYQTGNGISKLHFEDNRLPKQGPLSGKGEDNLPGSHKIFDIEYTNETPLVRDEVCYVSFHVTTKYTNGIDRPKRVSGIDLVTSMRRFEDTITPKNGDVIGPNPMNNLKERLFYYLPYPPLLFGHLSKLCATESSSDHQLNAGKHVGGEAESSTATLMEQSHVSILTSVALCVCLLVILGLVVYFVTTKFRDVGGYGCHVRPRFNSWITVDREGDGRKRSIFYRPSLFHASRKARGSIDGKGVDTAEEMQIFNKGKDNEVLDETDTGEGKGLENVKFQRCYKLRKGSSPIVGKVMTSDKEGRRSTLNYNL